MPIAGYDHFVLSEKGGVQRATDQIFSHRMPGALDADLLQNTVAMTVEARLEADRLFVQVDIGNFGAGHHVPTDSPLRHLILLLRSWEPGSGALSLVDGSVIPAWGGIGDPASGCYAGQPGKAFAKVLQEVWTEQWPSGAYWNPTRVLSDNRIPALATDSSVYEFEAPARDAAEVEAVLLLRRAYKDLADQKGWSIPDQVMEQVRLTVER